VFSSRLQLLLFLILALYLAAGCGGVAGEPPGSVTFKQEIPLDAIGDLTITTEDKSASATFAQDIFKAGTEVRLTNIFPTLSNVGLPEGRNALSAVEFTLVKEGDETVVDDVPPPDGGGDSGEDGADGTGEGDGTEGAGEGTGEGATESVPDDIGGSITLEMTLSLTSKWPADSTVLLYRWSSGVEEWQDSGITATISTDGRKASAVISRFGRYAVMSALPEELPPPAPGSLTLVAATKTAVILSWQSSSYAEFAGFNLYKGTDPTGSFSKLNSEPLTETEYRDAPVDIGGFYYYLTLINTGGLEGDPGPALAVEVKGTDYYGAFGDYGAPDNLLGEIRDIAILPLSHEILVADSSRCHIVVYSPLGEFKTYIGGRGDGGLDFRTPSGIGISPDGKTVYIADTDKDRIVILDHELAFLETFGGTGSGEGFMENPSDVAVRYDGVVFVTDTRNNRVQYFTPRGTYLGEFGTQGDQEAILSAPDYIVATPDGSFYVSDSGNARVVKFSAALEFESEVSLGEMGYIPPLETPEGLALDSEGKLFIADGGRNRILVAGSSGEYSYLFGSFGNEHGEFGESGPQGLAFDSITGLLYAADPSNNRVQIFQP